MAVTEEQMVEMEKALQEADDSDLGWMDPHNTAVYIGLARAVPVLIDEIRALRGAAHG